MTKSEINLNKILKNILKYTLTGVILFGSIYLSFRNIEFAKLSDILKTVNYWWVIATVPVILLSHWVRALRWKTMLNPIMKVSSLLNLFSAVMIGYFFNNIIPRGGEFIRPYVLSKREKVSFSSLFATILIERILDVLFLMLIFGSVFAYSDKIVNILPKEVNPSYIYILLLLLIVIIVSTFFPPVVHFFLKFIKPLSEKLFNKLTDIFNKLQSGFSIIKKPSLYLRLSVESLSIWLLYALPLYFIFFAFPFQTTYNLGVIDALMLVIVAGVGVTIAPSPGAIGVYHLLITTAMVQLYGISAEEGMAYAIVTHFVSRAVELLTGLVFYLRENIGTSPFSMNFSSSELEKS